VSFPVFRYRLSALLILAAVLAALFSTSVIRFRDRGVIRAIRAVIRLAPEAEKRDQQVRDLVSP
jgi:hypothetical protein